MGRSDIERMQRVDGDEIDGSVRVGESQLGGAPGLRRRVVPGRRSDGRVSRCLTKVTWKELKMCPVVLSQRQ